jgi:hypothetical protein
MFQSLLSATCTDDTRKHCLCTKNHGFAGDPFHDPFHAAGVKATDIRIAVPLSELLLTIDNHTLVQLHQAATSTKRQASILEPKVPAGGAE